jgi:acylphosphatase
MGLVDAVKSLFAREPKRMTGATFSIQPATPHINNVHQFEVAARRLNLLGWAGFDANSTVQAELEGEFDAIQTLRAEIDAGKVIPGIRSSNMILRPFKQQFNVFQVKNLYSPAQTPVKPPPTI